MIEASWTILQAHTKPLLLFAVLFLLLERAFPAKPMQKKWRKDSWVDLTYSYLYPLLSPSFHVFSLALLSAYFLGTTSAAIKGNEPNMVYSVLEQGKNGVVNIDQDGTIHYSPKSGFVGLDSVTTHSSDGQNTLTQTYFVKVTPSSNPGEDLSGNSDLKYRVEYALTSKVHGGEITEGVSGVFLNMRSWIGSQHLLVQILLAMFIMDFVGYWRHRMMHLKFLWPFHSIHHSSKWVDWLSTERFHPVNYCITIFFNFAVLVSPFQDPYVGTLSISIRRGYGLFVHSNVRFSYGFLDYIFVSPLFHRWHHSDSRVLDNHNFATIFSFLDRIFGTFYLPENKKDAESFGVYGDPVPNEISGQLLYPFIQFAKIKLQ